MYRTYLVGRLKWEPSDTWQLSSNGPHLWGAPVSQRMNRKAAALEKTQELVYHVADIMEYAKQ